MDELDVIAEQQDNLLASGKIKFIQRIPQ